MTSQTGGTVEGPYGSWDYITDPYNGCYYGYNADVPTCSCSGPITTVYTWQPDGPGDDPPQQVVIYEHCETEWIGKGDNVPGGSCDDGLGDPATYDYEQQSDGSYSGSGSSSGTRYQIKLGEQTITINCSPEAENDAGNDGEAFVHYWSNVTPLEVVLTGGIGYSSNKHYLIGQQCSATLDPGGLTPSNYNWTVSGGDVFKSWTASNASSVFTPMGSETGNSLTCHFKKEDAPTVTCTVDLAVPSGANPAGGFPGTVVTQQCSTDKPSAALDVYIGTVTDLPTSTNPDVVQLQQFYYDPPSGEAEGINWSGTITTPSQYVTSGDYGSWNWTQLITAGRQEKNNGVYWQFAVDTTTPPTIINGFQILDGSYPYGNFWYSSDGTPNGNADSPAQPLDSSSDIRAYDVLDSFNDYLMYQPPGTNSVPVPLKSSDWYWEFHATKDDFNAWSTSGEGAQWEFDEDFPDFPEWTFYAPMGSLTYVAP